MACHMTCHMTSRVFQGGKRLTILSLAKVFSDGLLWRPTKGHPIVGGPSTPQQIVDFLRFPEIWVKFCKTPGLRRNQDES